jgi:hypothetical protein
MYTTRIDTDKRKIQKSFSDFICFRTKIESEDDVTYLSFLIPKGGDAT